MTGRSFLLASAMVAMVTGLPRASADVLHLKDGTSLEGDVKRNNDGWVVISNAGKMTYVTPEQLKSIQMTPATNPSAATERLTSLRRSVDNMTDLKLIIDRYTRFLDTAGDDNIKAIAEEDLAKWKQRQQQGMVKLGTQWIAPSEKARVQEEALGLANQGREYVKQGRLKEADPLLQQAIAVDPGCASAHYLRGLVLLRQDQFPAARKHFEATLQLVPDHVPTLNNLAITISRQNQVVASLNPYDRAMMAAPGDRWVLTNVAEVLESLPDEARRSDIARKVQRRFDEQIVQLEATLANEGLYRWGATWVNADELQRLRAIEQEHKAKLDAMAVDYDALQAGVTRIDQQILDNQATMRRIEAESVRYDFDGRPVRLAYPPVYYELQRDNQRMTNQRAGEIRKMEQLRTAARTLQRQLPTPKFTGTQQVMGIEGTPLVAIEHSANTPATQPAVSIQPAPAPATQPTQ